MKWPAFTVGVMTLIATGMVAAQANEGKTGAGARNLFRLGAMDCCQTSGMSIIRALTTLQETRSFTQSRIPKMPQ